jgi:predicted AAA+ superfamily ATPase
MNKRKLYFSVISQLQDKEFCIITGPRQSGKTVLLSQIAEYLKNSGEKVLNVTLEDPLILKRLNEHPEKVFDYIIPDHSKRQFLLIDEIQYLNNPANFLKLLYDLHQPWLKIVATGSSAFYIDKKFDDSLAGRKHLFELFTLGFDEFLEFKTGNRELTSELEQIRNRKEYASLRFNEIENYFMEYITYGGYPAVVLAPDREKKITMLKEILNSYVKRDITESGINETEKFYHLMLLLSHQTGRLVNMNELANTLRLSITAVENYLYTLRKCYHIQFIRPFYMNLRKELTKMPKVYFNDLGIRNVLMNLFSQVDQRIDRGELTENYAYIRLRDSRAYDSMFYWRTSDGHEVDFIIRDSLTSGEAFEIKYDYNSFNPVRYRKFREAYPGIPLKCFSLTGTVGNHVLKL